MFFVVEFRTATGWQVSPTCTTLRKARNWAQFYANMSGVAAARIMRGGQGGKLVQVVK